MTNAFPDPYPIATFLTLISHEIVVELFQPLLQLDYGASGNVQRVRNVQLYAVRPPSPFHGVRLWA